MAYINNNTEKSPSNRSRVFRLIYQNEKVAKQDIAYSLEMSLPTVSQYLKDLEEQKLIKEAGAFKSTGGRKAKAITYIKESKYAIGLDITKNHVGIALINLAGECLEHARFKKPFYRTHAYFKSIGDLISQFIEENIPQEKILGVGVSIPGIIDDEGKNIVFSHALGLSNIDCIEFIEFIPYPCIFCNDANAAGIAEMWNKENIYNAAYLSLSNSVGGAIMIGKQLYLGDNQRSAELGHMTIVPDGRQCYCGKKGCLDAYCSANVLAANAFGGPEAFFEKLRNGNEKCRSIWDEYLKYLAIAVNSLRMLFDCDVIVGGYVGSFLDEHIQTLREKASKLNTFTNDALYLKSCSYKTEASAVGAALQNIETFINLL